MKKFIIVIVFVFLVAIFISFNYLLWDREKQLASFQDISDSKNLTIDTLSEKMNALDKLNKELNKSLETLLEDNTLIKGTLSMLSAENTELKKEITSKNETIGVFKKNIDVVPMETLLKKWVEAVDSKNYKGAQTLISKNSKDEILSDSVKFTEAYQRELKNIEYKKSELFTKLTDDEHLEKLQFIVVFEVAKPDSNEESKDKIPNELFKKGDNTKYVTMEQDIDTGEWRISSIADKP